MPHLPHLRALDAELARTPATVSVWCAPAGATRPAYARHERLTHYAASTMKLGVLSAAYRAHRAGAVDLDTDVRIVNRFESAKPGAPRYALAPQDDNEHDVWDRLGQAASLRWLARRMIVVSGNLAANTVLSHVGLAAVADVMALAGAEDGRIERGIGDLDARDAGIDNRLSARDLAMLLGFIAQHQAAAEMLDVLLAQRRREDLAAGLPTHVRLAHKNGFVHGVRHAAGVVLGDDAPPYILVVCTTTPAGGARADRMACDLIARVAAASWQDRHRIGD